MCQNTPHPRRFAERGYFVAKTHAYRRVLICFCEIEIFWKILQFFFALVKILSQRLIFDAYCCNIILLLLNYYVLGGMLWIQNTKACLRRGKSRIAKSKTAL